MQASAKDLQYPVRRRGRKKRRRTFLSLVVWLACALLLIVIGLLAFIHFSSDYGLYIVRSESMAPTINLGDLVFTGPAGGASDPAAKIKVGSVIAYSVNSGTTLHRVVGITDDGYFVTKGDNSEAVDAAPVSRAQVQGLYIFRIPYLGYVANFVRTPFGWCLCIILPTCIVLALIAIEIIREIKRHKVRQRDRDAYGEVGDLDSI